jgi:hypothetical protein
VLDGLDSSISGLIISVSTRSTGDSGQRFSSFWSRPTIASRIHDDLMQLRRVSLATAEQSGMNSTVRGANAIATRRLYSSR